MPILNANGQPYPASTPEQDASKERITAALKSLEPQFAGAPATDIMLVGINLLCAFVERAGPPEGFPQRLEMVMNNLGHAMQQAASVAELNMKVRAGLAAANEQQLPS